MRKDAVPERLSEREEVVIVGNVFYQRQAPMNNAHTKTREYKYAYLCALIRDYIILQYNYSHIFISNGIIYSRYRTRVLY